jgi:transposase
LYLNPGPSGVQFFPSIIATYYSAVCLETGEVEAMVVSGNTTAETSVTFMKQLRKNHKEPLIVIWDNGPAHHGPEMREYLATPDLKLRLVALPGYSPDFNPDEAIWAWVREEVTADICFGTAAKVREKVDAFFAGLAARTSEVKQRCRRDLQAQADALIAKATQVAA